METQIENPGNSRGSFLTTSRSHMEEKAPSLVVAEAVEARVHPAPAAQPVAPSSAPQALPRGRRVGEKDHAPSPRDSTPAPARRSEDPKPVTMVKASNLAPVRLPPPPPASIHIDAPPAPKPAVKPAPSAPATHKRSWVRDILLVVTAVAITFAVHYLKIF